MASHNNMLKVDGKRIKSPSSMTWGLYDVSASDSGRTQDTIMHKNRVGRKRKLNLSWSSPTPAEAKEILTAFAPEYFNVSYFDPLVGAEVTKNFYCGDQSAPVKIWTVGNKLYENISLDVIER